MRQLDLVPVLTLIALVLLGLAGWWLFPWLHHVIFMQDCIASGHNNC